MVDYTFIISVVTAYCFNFLMLYKKNRLFHNMLFIAISGVSLWLTSQSRPELTLVFYPMLGIGFISLVYDSFVSDESKI